MKYINGRIDVRYIIARPSIIEMKINVIKNTRIYKTAHACAYCLSVRKTALCTRNRQTANSR